MRKTLLTLLLCFLALNYLNAQSIDLLKQQIHEVLKNKKAHVGVAIEGVNPKDIISINGDSHLPMQSVFKYHLALAVLHQVDLGKLDLNESITIDKKTIEKYNHLWSPLRKKYPNGAEISLAEMIEYTVAWSDNLGCDLLFELAGGLKVVENYLHNIGIKDIAIVHNEINMQAQWDRQFENWTTAKAANKTLKLFYKNANNLLSKKSYGFLLDVLKGTQTGKKSIRGFLPKETIVAHKTGHSGKNKEGLTGAVNDIGIVFLPDGSHFYLSVLVSNSTEPDTTNQRIIAEIAKLTWDYFNN
ncbi:class A beta-lactamase, subclass A2 [Tenacibaculum xiamenense]|uniref:class A beta-lactamase, subclass A2 n=1 Tax=Tenacibaculum xiamenense TaxID=1261553 RepID=UPI0038B52D8C